MKKIFPVLMYMNLPNVITTVGMVFGVFACYFLINRNIQAAFICLALAMFMDLIDGFLAEKLNQQTEFGRYVDSLVDFFVCCIVPILLVFMYIGGYFILFVSLAFYVACGLWRLAYYNAREADNYFVGLPVPGAMLLVCMAVWTVVHLYVVSWLVYTVLFISGILMISPAKLKKYGWWQKVLWVIGVLFFGMVLVLW